MSVRRVKLYACSHGKDAGWVLRAMAQEGTCIGIQPGQGTKWGQASKLPELGGKRCVAVGMRSEKKGGYAVWRRVVHRASQ